MRSLVPLVLAPLALAAMAIAQDPPRPAGTGVRFDDHGWPVVPGDPEPLNPPSPSRPAERPTPPVEAAAEPTRTAARLASGMQLGSPLVTLFQATRSPGAFRELGGRVVFWRLVVHGPQGEAIGEREVVHTLDCTDPERDRLELPDGRVYGRTGALVAVEQRGMPWPTLVEPATHELMLFGLHARLPFVFADERQFVVVGNELEPGDAVGRARIVVERRPPPEQDLLGPLPEPRRTDRFELVHEPSSGQLHEFVHRFAASGERRRVLLDDWRDVGGVRLPFRRVYVDEARRPTTTLEILRIESARTSERDFRLR